MATWRNSPGHLRLIYWREVEKQTNTFAGHKQTGLSAGFCSSSRWFLPSMRVSLSARACRSSSGCKCAVTEARREGTPVCFVFVSYPSFGIAACSIWGPNSQLLFSVMRQRLGTSWCVVSKGRFLGGQAVFLRAGGRYNSELSVEFCFLSFLICMHGCVAPEQCVLSDSEVITWFICGLFLAHHRTPLDLSVALCTELSFSAWYMYRF